MLIKLRIYRKHDIDLMALLANSSFDFVEAVKNSLRMYVRGVNEKIPLPTQDIYTKVVDYTSAQVNVILSESADADIIAFVNSLPKGTRNCLLKSLLRNSLEEPFFRGAFADLKYKTKAEKNLLNVDKMVYDVIHTDTNTQNNEPIILDAAADILGGNK